VDLQGTIIYEQSAGAGASSLLVTFNKGVN